MVTIYTILSCLLLQLVAVNGIKVVPKHNEKNHRKLIQSFANNFPSITRDLHPKELELKAHSSIHLGEKQPEIFASLESVLTPYFQEILGENLIAYDLKVKYSEGEQVENVPDIVITNMLVSCILTVRSDSVDQLKYHTHDHANEWFFDFFDGLNVYKFLGQLRDNEIDVGEIVFQDEEFRSPLLNGGILDMDPISLGGPGSAHGGGSAGAIVGAFVGVMVVGGVLAYRYKEKIPWDKIQEKSFGGGSSATGSLGSSDGSSSKRTAMSRLSNGIEKGIEASKRLSETIQKKLPTKEEVNSKLDEVKSKVGPKLDQAKSKIAPKLDQAKSKLGFIQERVSMYSNSNKNTKPMMKPVREDDDDDDEEEQDSKRKNKNRTSLLDSNPYNPFAPHGAPSEGTYSVGGDFGVGEEYEASVIQRSPTISAYSGGYGGREIVFGDNDDDVEEFSMPDDYNTVADDYSVHCHSILGLLDGQSVVTSKEDDNRTILSRKASVDDDDSMYRPNKPNHESQHGETVPSSPFFTDMDEWSMDGYSLASRPAAPRSNSGGRSHLNMPNLR